MDDFTQRTSKAGTSVEQNGARMIEVGEGQVESAISTFYDSMGRNIWLLRSSQVSVFILCLLLRRLSRSSTNRPTSLLLKSLLVEHRPAHLKHIPSVIDRLIACRVVFSISHQGINQARNRDNINDRRKRTDIAPRSDTAGPPSSRERGNERLSAGIGLHGEFC